MSVAASYRPEIDGLRAIAVAAVILFHGQLAPLPGGFAGVDVFFVISGYLIGGLILDDLAAGASRFCGSTNAGCGASFRRWSWC